MDQDEAAPGAPIAGSPEVQNVMGEPVGGVADETTSGRSMPFDLAAGELDHGRYNTSSGQFE
jgi:hypothetical protein